MTVPDLPADGVRARPSTPTTSSTQRVAQGPTETVGAVLDQEPEPSNRAGRRA